jgi:hypothetical protein
MENFTSFLPRRVVSVADVNFAKKDVLHVAF